MPRIIYTEKSYQDLQRLLEFMLSVAPHVKDKMIDCLIAGIEQLAITPMMGKSIEKQDIRELIIPFGRSAYVVLYAFNVDTDTVEIARIRHGKESGFP